MIVYKLTQSQIDQLQDFKLESGALINLSVKDRHGNTIISQQVYECVQIGEPIDYEPIKVDEE